MGSNWTKKDKVACTIIFIVAILTFAVFFSGITLSYFFDTHTAFDAVEAGQVNISLVGGPDNDGQIRFPSVITPNTLYSIDDYLTGTNKDLSLRVQNNSSSGPVFIMVKLASDFLDIISPVGYVDKNGGYWVRSDNSVEYLYYMTAVEKNAQTNPLCYYWQVGNFPNPEKNDAGTYSNIILNVKAYAIQAQGGAVSDIIANPGTEEAVKGWQYAPQIFKDMVESYS